MDGRRIFVTCDASERRTGACLSFGETWETARPVAWDSAQLSQAEKNYPTHEKEMLAIVRALKKFRADLLGTSFTVYTDHRTLECFQGQRDPSRRQARWQEFLAEYDFTIEYVKGEENTVSCRHFVCLQHPRTSPTGIATIAHFPHLYHARPASLNPSSHPSIPRRAFPHSHTSRTSRTFLRFLVPGS